MKAKPGGFLATQTSETLPILPNASSMSNLRKVTSVFKNSQKSSTSSLFCFLPFAIKTNKNLNRDASETEIKLGTDGKMGDYFRRGDGRLTGLLSRLMVGFALTGQ